MPSCKRARMGMAGNRPTKDVAETMVKVVVEGNSIFFNFKDADGKYRKMGWINKNKVTEHAWSVVRSFACALLAEGRQGMAEDIEEEFLNKEIDISDYDD